MSFYAVVICFLVDMFKAEHIQSRMTASLLGRDNSYLRIALLKNHKYDDSGSTFYGISLSLR